MYILCLVIPTKVNTSQVPQQNVKGMPTVMAQISITCHSENSSVTRLLSLNDYCSSGCNVSSQDMTKNALDMWSEFPKQT